MAGSACVGLQHGAVNRKAGVVRKIEVGCLFHHVFARKDVGANTVQAHDVGPADLRVLRAGRHGHVQIAAWREHHVVVQVLGHTAPQRHGVLIKRRVVLHHVVGAHDGRVAPRVARADVAFFQHGNILDAMVLGQVVGRGQPVSTAAHDDHVIALLGLGVAPGTVPILVSRQCIAQQGPG